MTAVLVDHDIEGQASILRETLRTEGWLDLWPLELLRFTDVGLPINSSDRSVWRFAQERQMLLLTNNRNARGADSLGQTISDEATLTALPALTVGSIARLSDQEYRARCAERIVEIAADLDRYFGTGRIFIP